MAMSHVQGEFLYAWTRFASPLPLPKPTVFNKRLFFNPQTHPVKPLWAPSHHARPKITNINPNTNTNTKIKSTKISDLWFFLSKSQIQTQILKQTKTHKLKKKKKEHIIEKQELQQTNKKKKKWWRTNPNHWEWVTVSRW